MMGDSVQCEPWCGGELSPGTGREFCKCMRPDRYFCTAECMAAERPLLPQPDVPAHEAWTLRRMMESWRGEFERASGVACLLLVLGLSGCIEASAADACKKACAPQAVASIGVFKCECVVTK